MNWNIEQLKTELKGRKSVRGYIIAQENIHRRERYLMVDGAVATDQDREIHSQAVDLRVFVDIGKTGRQGEVAKKLFKEMPLAAQVDAAIQAASQTDHQAWDLPAQLSPSQVPEVRSCDPRMAEDLPGTMDRISREMVQAASAPRPSQFNSAELFLSVHHREVHLSNGLVHRSSQSRMYAEAAYSFAKDGKSDEYLHASWTIRPEDLSVKELFHEAAERAEHSLDCKKPGTGKYSVLIDAEVLSTLMNGLASHLQASSEYHQLPFKKQGDSLIPGATGDLITMTLDPSLDFGAVTVAVADQGVAQKPLILVNANEVVATATDQQHGSYLGKKPTTYKGNVVLSPGKLEYQDLLQASTKVVEILQFSGLFLSPHTGTFSSEIRLARLHDHASGQVTYIKGGSLSGSIFENFKHARFSRETAKRSLFDYGQAAGYFGPKYALISDVSIVG